MKTIQNSPLLQSWLSRDEYLKMVVDSPVFQFDDVVFDKMYAEVHGLHPNMPALQVEVRAAYRLLSRGHKNEIPKELRLQWLRKIPGRLWAFMHYSQGSGLYFYARIVWAILVLVVLLFIAAGRAHAQGSGVGGRTTGGITLQGFNGNTPLFARGGGLVVFKCSTNLTCTWTAATSTFTLTSTGGGGSGCVPSGSTPTAFVYDTGGGLCDDVPKLTFNAGTSTIALLAGGTFDVTAGTFKINALTCTNQALTAISATLGKTCTTLTSAFVDTSIALTGADINTSSNVTSTHIGGGTNTDLVTFNATGNLINYGGVTCTNQVLASLSAAGAGGCHTVVAADTSGAFTAAAHNLLSATHGDTTASSPTRGGGIFAIGASPTWTQVAHSSATGGYFKWNGTDQVASTLGASGTGACGTHNFQTADVSDTAPSCAQPTLADIAAGVAPAGAFDFTGATPTVPTQSASDNSTKAASTAYVTTAIANAVAGVNPATAVQAATTAAADTSGFTYSNGVGGIGATFTGSVNTAVIIDGFTFTALGQRLLVKNDTQSPSGAFNGVYYVTQVQTGILAPILTRALDYDQPSDINNTGAIPVVNGTVNAQTTWVETSTVNTVGTDPLTFVKFSLNPSTLCAPSGTVSRILLDNAPSGCADLSSLGTATTVLHGNAAGAPSFAAVTSADTTGTFTATAHNLLSTTHGDTLAASVSRGDLIVGNATPAWSRLGIGGNGTCLTSNGTDASWGSCATGSGVTLQTDSVNNASQTALNLLDSAATNGITLTHTNTSGGNVQLGLSGVLTVPGGGTGLGTLTAHALYVGNATGNPVAIALGNNGQVLESCGAGCSPSFQDPIVSGPDAIGASQSRNPVQIGGVDINGLVHNGLFLNGPTQGNEFGLVVRDADDNVQLSQLVQLNSAIANQRLRGTFNRPLTSTGDALDVNLKFANPCTNPRLLRTINISQTASTRLFVGEGYTGFLCGAFVFGADAENVSIVSGSGATCGSTQVAVVGGVSAANGPNMAANQGWVLPFPVPIPAQDVCLLQSGSGRVAGVLTYAFWLY